MTERTTGIAGESLAEAETSGDYYYILTLFGR